MKLRPLIIAFVLSGFAIIATILIPIYLVEVQAERNVSILSNTNEAFIFVGKQFNGYSGSLSYFTTRGVLGAPTMPKNNRTDLYLVHIFSYSYTVNAITNFPWGGNAFIYEGNLYYECTTNTGQTITVWEYNGSSFDELDKLEGGKVLGAFDLFENLLVREKWTERRLRFDQPKTNIFIELNDSRIRLELTVDRASDFESLAISGIKGDKQSRDIFALTNSSKYVSKGAYYRLFRR